jgi:hypothetical protein
MSVIAAALEVLFNDPNLTRLAVYRPGGIGDGVPLRIFAKRPDQVIDFGETRVHAETSLVDVLVASIDHPRPGDSIEIDGQTLVVQGEPVRDLERLIWTLDVRPQ